MSSSESDLTFLYACEDGELERVKDILEDKEFDIHVTNCDNENALMVASGNSHHQIVEILLDTGEYDVYARNIYNDSTLMIAASRGCPQTSFNIIKKNDKDAFDDHVRYHGDRDREKERERDRVKTCRLIIDKMKQTEDQSQVSFREFTSDVLHYACKEDHLYLVKALVDTGKCDLNTKDVYDSTVLVYARSPRIVKELTREHVFTEEQIQKALWSAYRLGRPDVMRCLIEDHDADAYRPHADPMAVFHFKESVLPDMLDGLSKENKEYADVRLQGVELLRISHQSKKEKEVCLSHVLRALEAIPHDVIRNKILPEAKLSSQYR